ncbi:MAG: molybdopterin-dependent oxidoreductase [Candidatus Tectomicrobia bacterium]|nr:molybdopterin-dependent oxidoreductase [Candidatus Tectomicrobia bacterium]
MVVAAQAPVAAEDVWIPSACSMCYGTCSILGHRVDGVLTKIEGNPESVLGKGRLCGKGISGIMTLYDPHRLNKPLRRTNPEKGIGVDPKWEEISWDEALDIVGEKLRHVRQDDPRKLFIQRTTTNTSSRTPWQVFGWAFGTPNSWVAGGGLHCGNGAHLISGIMHASWSVVPDFQYCNYAVYFGASKGHSAGHASCSNMGMAADARARGMHMVVVDPICNFAGAKATEWVPLRVGTDAAIALGMCHTLVHELRLWDSPYLKAKTNGPYLTGPDGRYLRDAATNKPLVWDTQTKSAKPFDAVEPEQMALEGVHTVSGLECPTAFERLKAHLKPLTPEWGESISTVPAATIRRLGQEFGREARIGSTIEVQGRTLPYRPVAAIAFRGAQGHKNSVYNFLAVDLLNELVGSADMVGGCLGFNPSCHGHPETGRPHYIPYADEDGLMITGIWMAPHLPYPMHEPRMPETMSLIDLYPMTMMSPLMASSDQEEMWQRFDLPYRPEVLLNFGCNSLLSVGNAETVAKTLKRIPFIISIDLFITEFSEFADIVLPDCSYMEAHDSRPNFPFIFNLPGGMGEWCWPVKQPVVEAAGERRESSELLVELADRIGIREDLNEGYNVSMRLAAPFRLERDKRYTYREICDMELKSNFGPEHGLEWFKQHGVIKWPKKPEEVYWRHFENVRVPIYWEFLIDTWEQANALAEPRGWHIPREYYSPLPSFLPCVSHEETSEQHDLYAFYYRDAIHTNSFTMENPWLDETAQLDPFSYTAAMHSEAGRRKGLKDGDWVWIESVKGRRIRGRVHLTEAIHPEGLGIAACAGHWTEAQPIAKGKGVFINDLLEVDMEHSSPANLNLDLCVKVGVTRCDGEWS